MVYKRNNSFSANMVSLRISLMGMVETVWEIRIHIAWGALVLVIVLDYMYMAMVRNLPQIYFVRTVSTKVWAKTKSNAGNRESLSDIWLLGFIFCRCIHGKRKFLLEVILVCAWTKEDAVTSISTSGHDEAMTGKEPNWCTIIRPAVGWRVWWYYSAFWYSTGLCRVLWDVWNIERILKVLFYKIWTTVPQPEPYPSTIS